MKPMPNYDLFQSFGMLLYVIICIGIAYVWLKIRRPHLRIGLTIIVMITAYLASISEIPKDYGIGSVDIEFHAFGKNHLAVKIHGLGGNPRDVGSGVVVNLGLFTLLTSLGLNKYAASPLAIEASIVTNFLCNNYWTFHARRS